MVLSLVRHLAVALGIVVFTAAALPPAAAAQVRLTLRFRDAITGAPAGCRVHVTGPSGALFASPDSTLRTHHGGGLAPFVLAEDSLALDVPPATYVVRAVQGITGIPVESSVPVLADMAVTIPIARWVDPRADGWIAGDPHVHTSHAPSEYSMAGPEIAAAAARAEGLEVMALLANDAVHPGGAVTPPQPDVTLVWGEEYRTGYWGHVILLGLDALVLSAYGPGCCGSGQPAWPTLTAALAPAAPSLAILAHPHTTDNVLGTGDWPESGLARESPALALQSFIHGLAVVSASNAPRPWALREFEDGVAAGARWAAVGESDMTLDRYSSSAPGWPRTYAWIDAAPPAGSPSLGAHWQAAVRAGHCFATQGPIVQELRIAGGLPGDTAEVSTPAAVEVRLRAASWRPMQVARVIGVGGPLWSAAWPAGRTSLDTTVTVPVTGDDALIVELCAVGNTWYAPVDTVRAVTTPVWIEGGAPWRVPAAAARRGVQALQHYWQRSLVERGYASAQDSALAREQLLGAAAAYEGMVDDPPGPFALSAPPAGATLAVALAALEWRRSPSYDGEPTSYHVLVDATPEFLNPQIYEAGGDTAIAVSNLAAGATYWWRVQAEEPFEPPRFNEQPDGWFVISSTPLTAPPSSDTSLQLSAPWTSGDGLVHLTLTLGAPALVRARWVDVRGRVVAAAPPQELPAGAHPLAWTGRDSRGGRVAAGVYWLVAQTQRARAVQRVLLPRP